MSPTENELHSGEQLASMFDSRLVHTDQVHRKEAGCRQ